MDKLKLNDKIVSILIPAFLGALVANINSKEEQSVIRRAFQITSGAITASYLAPVIAESKWLNLAPTDKTYSAIVFMVGLAGFKTIPLIINFTVGLVKTYLNSTSGENANVKKN